MASGFDDDLWESLDAAYDALEDIGAGKRACEFVERAEVGLLLREGEDTTVREWIENPDTFDDYYEGIAAIILFPAIRETYEPEVQYELLMQVLDSPQWAIQVAITFGYSLPPEAILKAQETIRDWSIVAKMLGRKGHSRILQEW